MSNIEIYDLITKKIIIFPDKVKEIYAKCESLYIGYQSLLSLYNGTSKSLQKRYILLQNKEKIIFTLIDYDSNEEFECVGPRTLYLYLNIPFNADEAKGILHVLKQRQNITTINNRVFYLKGSKPKTINGKTRSENSEFIKSHRKINKLKKKIAIRLRRRLNSVIESQGTIKSNSTMKLLGCSLPDFLIHIETQFNNGMTWDNYGFTGWHMDHIIPCASFNLTIKEEQEKCFHYTNIQPLWRKDNLIKGSKITV